MCFYIKLLSNDFVRNSSDDTGDHIVKSIDAEISVLQMLLHFL